MTTTTTSGAADLRTAAQAVVDRWDTPLWKDVPATAEYIGRLRAALAAGQATAAPENIRGILARCRDFIDTTKAPAYPAGADLADEIDVLLAAQPAPQPSHVAQAVVPADLITLRKPTTSAELLWLLKLAHLVISDVDKTLEETFSPAQPAEASRFGSPELQAMIIARCVEKDQADSVQEDAACWQWLAEYLVGPRTDLDDEIVASETVNDLRKLVKAAIKQGATP